MGLRTKRIFNKKVLTIVLTLLALGVTVFWAVSSPLLREFLVDSSEDNTSKIIEIKSATINPDKNDTLEISFNYSGNKPFKNLQVKMEMGGESYLGEVNLTECSEGEDSIWECTLFPSDFEQLKNFTESISISLEVDSKESSTPERIEFLKEVEVSKEEVSPVADSSKSPSEQKSSGGGGGGGTTTTNPPTTPTCVSMTCATNYSGFCGSSLSNGCSGNLDCSTNCEQGYECSEGVCLPSCQNDQGCSFEGGFCEGNLPYNCTLNATSGCFYRTNLSVCPESCYGAECLSVVLVDSCREINSPGDYLLSENITNNSLVGACIKIVSEGVTLDCDNNFISSNSSATGIYTNQSATIKNCNISVGINSPGYGIEVYRASRVIIQNNILNGQYSGIYLSESNDSLIKDNVINFNTNKGVHISSGVNNTIQDNVISSGDFYGILLTKSSSNLILNNTLDSNGWYGLLVEASLDNTPDGENNLTNNTILNSRTGIYVKTSENRIVENFVNNSNLNHGLYVYGGNETIIEGNTLTYSAQYGLRIRNSNDNRISNNIVRFSGQQGLELSGGSLGNIFSTNVICSNSPDVTCVADQTFSNNYCDSGSVCGGTCNLCSLFSGFAISSSTGRGFSKDLSQNNGFFLLLTISLIIIVSLGGIRLVRSRKRIRQSYSN